LYEEELANKRWLQASTMACPGCEIHVEKNLGCNHVGVESVKKNEEAEINNCR